MRNMSKNAVLSAFFTLFLSVFSHVSGAEVRTVLSPDDTAAVALAADGALYAATSAGLKVYLNGQWRALTATAASAVAPGTDGIYIVSNKQLQKWSHGRAAALAKVEDARALALAGSEVLVGAREGLFVWNGKALAKEGPANDVRQIAVAANGDIAVAAANGLFEKPQGKAWERLLPNAGARSWAPVDVRGVAYDKTGRLCFASPQGAGCRAGSAWSLYTPEDGLPYDDFSWVATGGDGAVWFGTRIGAIRYDGKAWEYRQGLRWLPGDDVRGISVDAKGNAYFATDRGVSVIERKPMTLAEKARFFEDEIDKRHRRTPHEYVLDVVVEKAGDKTKWTQHDSDNDGLWTGMYGAGEAFACGAGQEMACGRAKKAFEALRFLGTVTQGGAHAPPRGFVARSVLPVNGPDPNQRDNAQRDAQMRATRDAKWKSLTPRWPVSADGQWYWKTDTSSDELDGHYFFYGVYYDLAAKTEAEKQRVREHVAALTDHLLSHNYQLVDHDGKATRWGVFNPEEINRDVSWWEERGLNSISMLSYLKTAEHITGDAKYAAAARELREKHAYDMNTMISKTNAGPGSGNQSDDEMAFMCLYNLMRYETDARLRMMYGLALRKRWEIEAPELCPLFNYIAAAGLKGQVFEDAFGKQPLDADGAWREESMETLERFPLDRFNWALKNSHRKDLTLLPPFIEGNGRGYRRNGKVLPIDERHVGHWNHDPWRLDTPGNGRSLADGAAFLLPYYMGLYHGFIQE